MESSVDDINDDQHIEQQGTNVDKNASLISQSLPSGGFWNGENVAQIDVPMGPSDWKGETTRSTNSTNSSAPVHSRASVKINRFGPAVEISGSTAKERATIRRDTASTITENSLKAIVADEPINFDDADTLDSYSVTGSNASEARRRTLQSVNINDEVRRAITDEVIRHIQRQLGTNGTLLEFFKTLMMQTTDEIKKWIEVVNQARDKATLADVKAATQSTEIQNEKFELLEKKVEVILTSQKDSTGAQQQILVEGMNIVRENQVRRKRYREALTAGEDLGEIVRQEIDDTVSVAESERVTSLQERIKELEEKLKAYENLPTRTRGQTEIDTQPMNTSGLQRVSGLTLDNAAARALQRNLRNR